MTIEATACASQCRTDGSPKARENSCTNGGTDSLASCHSDELPASFDGSSSSLLRCGAVYIVPGGKCIQCEHGPAQVFPCPPCAPCSAGLRSASARGYYRTAAGSFPIHDDCVGIHHHVRRTTCAAPGHARGRRSGHALDGIYRILTELGNPIEPVGKGASCKDRAYPIQLDEFILQVNDRLAYHIEDVSNIQPVLDVLVESINKFRDFLRETAKAIGCFPSQKVRRKHLPCT